MTNILVTGGTGFIGSFLVKDLSENNKVVVIVRDRLPNKWVKKALRKATIIKGDILDYELLRRVISDYQIEEVYHLAAQAIVSVAIKEPITTFKINTMGTVNLLEACRAVNPDIKILIQSTDKVYGGDRMYATEEDDLATTIGIYETSKACEDIISRAYRDIYNMNIRISRPCNVYGYDNSPRIIPNTIRQCLEGKRPIIFKGQENSIRQYVHVEDVVSALKLIMENFGIFNIGTDDIINQEEVVKVIAKFFNIEPIYMERKKPIKEIHQQCVRWDKLKSIGWMPKFSFEEGIKETIERFKEYDTSV